MDEFAIQYLQSQIAAILVAVRDLNKRVAKLERSPDLDDIFTEKIVNRVIADLNRTATVETDGQQLPE